MDLIYTDASGVDQGALNAYAFDLSFGEDSAENDFELTLSKRSALLEYGAYIYIEGTEYGGTIDGMGTKTDEDTITYVGRTWHGILNSKVIKPDSGQAYLTVSGSVTEIFRMLIDRLSLGDFFAADDEAADVSIPKYSFDRYCLAYDGIRKMLSTNGLKLRIEWRNRAVYLSAVPVADYTESPVDDDMAVLNVEKRAKTVNHLVCLGRGELEEREVLHLYADAEGNISKTQHYFGMDEIEAVYEYSGVESFDELEKSGRTRFKDMRNADKAEISAQESGIIAYDVGDIIGATDIYTGISASTTVAQKTVRIENGAMKIEYKAGG